MFEGLVKFFLNPETEVAKEAKKANYKDALRNYNAVPVVVAFLIGALVSIISVAMMPFLNASKAFATSPAYPLIQLVLSIGIFSIILMPIVTAIAVTVMSLLSNLILWVALRIVGAKTEFLKLYYVMSVMELAVMLLIVPLVLVGVIFMMIPFVGILVYLLMISMVYAIMAYVMYASWTILKKLTNLDNESLIAAMAIFYIILMILAMIVVGIVILGIVLSGIGAAMSPGII